MARLFSRSGRGDWLRDLPFSTVAFRRCVAIHRNLDGAVFPERQSPEGRETARGVALRALRAGAAERRMKVEELPGTWEELRRPEAGGVLRDNPFEGLPMPRDPEALARASFATVGKGAALAVFNAEDHLSLYAASNAPYAAQWRELDAVLAGASHEAPFAHDTAWGYLSANPDHAGTGLALSFDVCLFGLCLSRTLDPALRALDRLGFETVPTFGPFAGDESSIDAPGCRYLVQSIRNAGTERDIVGRMDATARELSRQEQNARFKLLDAASPELSDFVARSVSAGAFARQTGQAEALDVALAVLFAADLRLLRLGARQRAAFADLVRVLSYAETVSADKPADPAAGADDRARRAALLRPLFAPLLPQLDPLP
ncbi:MAG: hypothetical protein IJV65_07370 [Kiritimatiellae bacterium]|nr:hypothetical protein [Kiritimatiellia bacterium]